MHTRFILIQTSHAGNVGGAARAMKTMGFDDLVLVAPRWANVLRREETIQRASGANDVLDKARIVETGEAVDRIEEIATVAGVDAIFIGPSDLAASLGHPGNAGHPEVVAKVEEAIGRLKAVGVPSGILTLDQAFARRCMDLGTTFTAVGVDMALLRGAAVGLARGFGRGDG